MLEEDLSQAPVCCVHCLYNTKGAIRTSNLIPVSGQHFHWYATSAVLLLLMLCSACWKCSQTILRPLLHGFTKLFVEVYIRNFRRHESHLMKQEGCALDTGLPLAAKWHLITDRWKQDDVPPCVDIRPTRDQLNKLILAHGEALHEHVKADGICACA